MVYPDAEVDGHASIMPDGDCDMLCSCACRWLHVVYTQRLKTFHISAWYLQSDMQCMSFIRHMSFDTMRDVAAREATKTTWLATWSESLQSFDASSRNQSTSSGFVQPPERQ